MMAEALRRAAADSGASGDLLGSLDALRVVAVLSRRYRNPARLVAGRVGARPRDEALSPVGGNEPQALVNRACLDIAVRRGRRGGDLRGRGLAHPQRHARDELGWTEEDPSVPPAAPPGPTWRWTTRRRSPGAS